MHILPIDVTWISWPLNLEIKWLLSSLFWTHVLLVSVSAVEYLLDNFDILVLLVSDEGANNICVILILL